MFQTDGALTFPTGCIEHDDEGPVAYFDTWYADCRTPSVTEASRPIRLDSHRNLWHRDLQRLWRDKIQRGSPVHISWVMPTPTPSPMSRTAGHLIVHQFPDTAFVPVLVSIHFRALHNVGISHALAVTPRQPDPFALVTQLNMERTCRGRKCTMHRGT